ncbi:YbhB/YbcL family Raf kinase inhibitor-like protein [Burkholderia cepacia]|uniref:YbhB/YbcL family Raf kinase inhibitor-like protein n=1 Tax=Burkholderia cepacia TaxID=292 RepID=UPI001F2ACC81|nr:YbhB/YbcL family Raf kinase inhibitor-like protein [Burkholderia cepacia]MCE4128220.1 YbhB/YbcL family Raf kinase inhibitor-like protein [Burkholderia cepacia]
MTFNFLPRSTFCSAMLLSIVPTIAVAGTFSVKVDDLNHGRFENEQVYGGFGCHGGNVSPRISWSHLPHGTKSVVVTIHDPDAPTGGLGWMHWGVVNIRASEASIEKGASGDPKRMPAGAVETLTDFGAAKYGGPCPPQGESHRYIVTVSALSVPSIDVNATSSPALVAYQMHGKVIARARYVAMYHWAAE